MTVEEKQSRTTTCADCNEIKPNASFQRLLSLAHSRAVLKQPNLQTRYTATSKFCRECRAKRKRKTPLTAKEIRNKITSGDLHSVRGEIILQQKRDALPQIRARGMKKRWQKVKSAPLKALKKRLQQQVAKYANRYHTYKHQQDGQENAMLAQHRYNYSQAKAVRDKVLREAESQLAQGKPIDVSLDADIGMMINPRFMTQYLLNDEGVTP